MRDLNAGRPDAAFPFFAYGGMQVSMNEVQGMSEVSKTSEVSEVKGENEVGERGTPFGALSNLDLSEISRETSDKRYLRYCTRSRSCDRIPEYP